MRKFKTTGAKSSGSLNWFVQRVSGLVLIVMLLVHFGMMHYVWAEDGTLTFEIVKERLQNPLWKTFDLVFLLLAIYHGLNGAWQVLLDFKMSKGMRLTLYGVIFTVGLLFLTLGGLTIITFEA